MSTQPPDEELLGKKPRNPASTRPATSSVPPTTTGARPNPFTWGVVGSLHSIGDLQDDARSYGVTRFVASSIQYIAPPLPNSWIPIRSEACRFDLPWPNQPNIARTLLSLRNDLQAIREETIRDGNHPVLAELDAIVYQLLRLTEQLHTANWRLGLVQPTNIIWPSAAEHTPTLIDLGFYWKGDYGEYPWVDSPGRPGWLESNLERNGSAWLWDHDPIRRQFAFPENEWCEPVPAGSDVKTLARLFAWLLTGRRDRAIPEPAEHGVPARKTWQALHLASTGRLESLTAFMQMIGESPLSRYFLQPIEPLLPRRKSGGLAVPIVLGLLALAGGGAAYYFLNQPKPTTTEIVQATNSENPVPTMPDALKEAVAKLESAQFPDKAKMLTSLFQNPIPTDLSGQVEKLRASFLDEWITEFTKLEEQASTDVTQRIEIGQRMKELHEQLSQLVATPSSQPNQQEREQQCLEQSALRVAELGSSP